MGGMMLRDANDANGNSFWIKSMYKPDFINSLLGLGNGLFIAAGVFYPRCQQKPTSAV